MLTIEPSGAGATVRGVDLRQDLSREDFGAVLRALGEHGGLCLPGQAWEAARPQALLDAVGDIQVIKGIPHHEPERPGARSVECEGGREGSSAHRTPVSPGTPT